MARKNRNNSIASNNSSSLVNIQAQDKLKQYFTSQTRNIRLDDLYK